MVNINAGNPWAHAARQRLNTNSLDDWLLKSHINCNLSIGNVCLPDIRGGYGLALASFAPGRRSDMRECRNAKTGARTIGAVSAALDARLRGARRWSVVANVRSLSLGAVGTLSLSRPDD